MVGSSCYGRLARLRLAIIIKNIINQIKGHDDQHTFKTELICIIDNNTSGTMVYRDPKRSLQMRGRPFHWAKVLFEWNYLRPYR